MALYLASPVLANNAVPLSGLPELFSVVGLFLFLVPFALVLTFFPKLAPTQSALQGLLATLATAGSLITLWLTLRLMQQEFKPESYREYWTGVFFLVPFTLCICSLAVVWVRRKTDAPRLHILLAWAIPLGLWLLVSLILFVVGTLSSHF
jgi:hypothetical protein